MNFQIADSELPIMQLLWQNAPQTSAQLLAQLPGNASTQKTLLKRLVEKGAVDAQPIHSRAFAYRPIVLQQDYERSTSRKLLQKVFGGSSKKMLLHFIEEDQITKQDLKELLDLIEEE